MSGIYDKILSSQNLDFPKEWLKIRTVDMHTGGEPLRVVLSGLPGLSGNSVLDYRRDMHLNHDHLRKALMFEPRGHADMYGCILLPPNDNDADFGILFMHNEGYSTMCGHAIIAVTKLVVEMGWVEMNQPTTKVTIDAPCGRIYSYATVHDNRVSSIHFDCVESFVQAMDQEIEVPDFGTVRYDLAYGGAFYAYVNADMHGIDLNETPVRQIADLGMKIKYGVISNGIQASHPTESDLSFLYGTIIMSKKSNVADSKNICVFANGEIDRSPTGSGVAGRMALHYAKNELAKGQEMSIESVTGSIFKGQVIRSVRFGPYDAVIPRVSGSAYITGTHEFLIDPDDPFKNGFLLH